MIPSALSLILYVVFLACGVMIMYSLMICLSATSIWLGRNQTLYNFWFYITNFSRYPMEIYNRGWGAPLYGFFTFVIPVLLVVNVPARLIAKPIDPRTDQEWIFIGWTLVATMLSVLVSRWVFGRALLSYRSASS
jgi:ABC-2 type transport system permease protein